MESQSLFDRAVEAQLNIYNYMIGKKNNYSEFQKEKWCSVYFSIVSKISLDPLKNSNMIDQLPECLRRDAIIRNNIAICSAYSLKGESSSTPKVNYAEAKNAWGSVKFFCIFPCNKNGQPNIFDIHHFLSSTIEGDYDPLISISHKESLRIITREDVDFYGRFLLPHIDTHGVVTMVELKDKVVGDYSDIDCIDPIL